MTIQYTIQCEAVVSGKQCSQEARLIIEELDGKRREMGLCWHHAHAYTGDRHSIELINTSTARGQGFGHCRHCHKPFTIVEVYGKYADGRSGAEIHEAECSCKTNA